MKGHTLLLTGLLALFAGPAVFVSMMLVLPSPSVSADAPLELLATREGPRDGVHTLSLKNPSTTNYTACEIVLDETSHVVPVGAMPAGEVVLVAVESWVDVSGLHLRCAEGKALQRWVPRVPQH